ncbi:MAG TPA: SAM-dependent methyltransferase [Planctomycetota bacterium]|nr:SAM-dependent methyltransferase [Planctomycetota bacterium]
MNLVSLVERALPRLVSATLSDPLKGDVSRVRIRPVVLRGQRRYQFESLRGARALHRNLDESGAARELVALLGTFRQGVIATEDADIHVVEGRVSERPASRDGASGEHDRTKRRLLAEGARAEFLFRLGVTGRDGQVLSAKQDKFRQMNRYLELVDDVLGDLPEGRVRVVDFGCGKSYLTFALHHLLRRVRGIDAEIIGLDLREEVIRDCASIARDLKLEGLRFEVGDIRGFQGVDRADLVVSLHACDTATDDALARAVAWGARVVLAVPCCQHELAPTISNAAQAALLRHGILRDRLASLVTDAMRAELLEMAGYSAQIIEFVDTEHTPKNLMIRAVWRGSRKSDREYRALRDAWGAGPVLEKLLERIARS